MQWNTALCVSLPTQSPRWNWFPSCCAWWLCVYSNNNRLLEMALTNVPLSLPQVRGHLSVTSATPPSRGKTRSTSTSRWCTTAIRSISATCARRPLSLLQSSKATRRWVKRARARQTSIIDGDWMSARSPTLSCDWVQAAFLLCLFEHHLWNLLHFELKVKMKTFH